MPTKAELEAENGALRRKVARLEKRLAEVPAPAPPEPEPDVVLEPPSPVDRGQLYVESHPILGVTRKAVVTKHSYGDGRIGDGATIERFHSG